MRVVHLPHARSGVGEMAGWALPQSLQVVAAATPMPLIMMHRPLLNLLPPTSSYSRTREQACLRVGPVGGFGSIDPGRGELGTGPIWQQHRTVDRDRCRVESGRSKTIIHSRHRHGTAVAIACTERAQRRVERRLLRASNWNWHTRCQDGTLHSCHPLTQCVLGHRVSLDDEARGPADHVSKADGQLWERMLPKYPPHSAELRRVQAAQILHCHMRVGHIVAADAWEALKHCDSRAHGGVELLQARCPIAEHQVNCVKVGGAIGAASAVVSRRAAEIGSAAAVSRPARRYIGADGPRHQPGSSAVVRQNEEKL
jgi:hypothetical protein